MSYIKEQSLVTLCFANNTKRRDNLLTLETAFNFLPDPTLRAHKVRRR